MVGYSIFDISDNNKWDKLLQGHRMRIWELYFHLTVSLKSAWLSRELKEIHTAFSTGTFCGRD